MVLVNESASRALTVFSASNSTKAVLSGEVRRTTPVFSADVQSAGTEIEKLLDGCLYSTIAGKAGVGMAVGCGGVVGTLTAIVARWLPPAEPLLRRRSESVPRAVEN